MALQPIKAPKIYAGDNKAFAISRSLRERHLFSLLQKTIKYLSLSVAFRQTMFHPDSYREKPLLSAKTLGTIVTKLNIMQRIILLTSISLSLNVYSQKIDTTFYDNDWKPVKTKDLATFYGTKQKINDSTVLIKDYFLTDTLQNKGQYINGVKKGRWTYYRPDGTIKTDFEFINDGKNKHWFTFDEDQLKPNDEGIYHTVNNHSKFMGDSKTPNQFINSNFILPERALKKGFTSFEVVYKIVIDEKGKVVEAYEMKSKGYTDKNGEFKSIEVESALKYGVDKALTDFLLNMPNWEPAIVRKQPVKSARNIYIKYTK